MGWPRFSSWVATWWEMMAMPATNNDGDTMDHDGHSNTVIGHWNIERVELNPLLPPPIVSCRHMRDWRCKMHEKVENLAGETKLPNPELPVNSHSAIYLQLFICTLQTHQPSDGHDMNRRFITFDLMTPQIMTATWWTMTATVTQSLGTEILSE